MTSARIARCWRQLAQYHREAAELCSALAEAPLTEVIPLRRRLTALEQRAGQWRSDFLAELDRADGP